MTNQIRGRMVWRLTLIAGTLTGSIGAGFAGLAPASTNSVASVGAVVSALRRMRLPVRVLPERRP